MSIMPHQWPKKNEERLIIISFAVTKSDHDELMMRTLKRKIKLAELCREILVGRKGVR